MKALRKAEELKVGDLIDAFGNNNGGSKITHIELQEETQLYHITFNILYPDDYIKQRGEQYYIGLVGRLKGTDLVYIWS